MKKLNLIIEDKKEAKAVAQKVREVKNNWQLCDELRKIYDDVFDFDEQSNFILSDGTKMKIKERVCEVVWKIEDELKANNSVAIINNNNDNTTIQAIIAWKLQEQKCKALEKELEKMLLN